MSNNRIRNRWTRRGNEINRLVHSNQKFGIDVGIFDPNMAKLGSYHEFGTSTIPQRSFIRSWFSLNRALVQQQLITVATAKWRNPAAGGDRDALKAFGDLAVRGIQQRILAHIPPALSPNTIRQKTGAFKTTPLIDQGTLFRSINWHYVSAGGTPTRT